MAWRGVACHAMPPGRSACRSNCALERHPVHKEDLLRRRRIGFEDLPEPIHVATAGAALPIVVRLSDSQGP
eukprot:UN4994